MISGSDNPQNEVEDERQVTGEQVRMQNSPNGGVRQYNGGGTWNSPNPLSSMADAVARINISVHVKLLVGFIIGAMLLLGMAILSLVVIEGMNRQVRELTRLQESADRARDMYYLVTAQSHYRAMALLTNDDVQVEKIAFAKQMFSDYTEELRTDLPERTDLVDRLDVVNQRLSDSGAKAQELYESGQMNEALRVHLDEEHPISHDLEAAMVELIGDTSDRMEGARTAFQSNRRLLTIFGWTFSGVSLTSAVLIGLVMSLSFIRPVRRIDNALASIAAGDFTQRVEVPNRDEFGTLSKNLNVMSEQLAHLYGELQSLNANLQEKVDDQVRELDRTARLKRYLSPQLADSILSGSMGVELASSRRNLTIMFADVRGFTPMSERLEPEELVDLLNQYLSEMTEIVFKYEGTLDKYTGDGLMVFFGNPIPYEDHAQRAVKTALEMQEKLAELQQKWFVQNDEVLTTGIGIATGYVTVGNIGSPARLDYTVVGNHVNLASRLTDNAEAGQILVSERTMVEVRDLVDGTEVDEIHLEGVSRPIKIYEVRKKRSSVGF